MGTRGVPPCSLHTCAWSGTCWNKSYLLFGECQVCVAQTGHRHARVVGSAPIARGPRSQCRSRPWWRRCQCLQPGFHFFYHLFYNKCMMYIYTQLRFYDSSYFKNAGRIKNNITETHNIHNKRETKKKKRCHPFAYLG